MKKTHLLKLLLLLVPSYYIYLQLTDEKSSSDIDESSAAHEDLKALPPAKSPEQTKEIQPQLAWAEPQKFNPQETEVMKSIQKHFLSGAYLTALKICEEAMAASYFSDKFKKWLIIQQHPLLISAGWLKLKTGDCQSAIHDLEKAQSIMKTTHISKGLAYCYEQLKNFSEAEQQISWHLAQEPNDRELLHIYEKVLESQGRYHETIQVLKQILALTEAAEEKAIIKKKITSMEKNSRQEQLKEDLRSSLFSVRYSHSHQQKIAEMALSRLDKEAIRIIEHFHFREPQALIEVIFYPGENFNQFVFNSPTWAEGLFDGRIKMPLYEHWLKKPELVIHKIQKTLTHELVHALFRQMTGHRQKIPPWFEEGMAQRASCAHNTCPPISFSPQEGRFLREETFLKPFTDYDRLKAQRVYKQSLYLILTIEYLIPYSLPDIISAIHVDSPLDSDSLLKVVDLKFSQLVRKSSELWEQRKVL